MIPLETKLMRTSSADQSTVPTTLELGPATPRVPLKVEAYGLTDTGKVRSSNEDNFLIAELAKALHVTQTSLPQAAMRYSQDRGHLFLVADGMGGHQAGEKASALAVQTIENFVLHAFKWFFQLRGPEGNTVLSEFQTALREADSRLVEESSRHPELRGMGTTLTMGYHFDARLFIVHVGDSRCYLQRGGKLTQLTRDHTLVAELARKGAMSAEEAATHQWRHVIVNVVGGNEAGVRVEAHKLELNAGDVVLLCSDGLTEMVSDERIAAVLGSAPEPKSAATQLVAEANANGGRDNITVVVARFSAVG